jgi:hypothetical protein
MLLARRIVWQNSLLREIILAKRKSWKEETEKTFYIDFTPGDILLRSMNRPTSLSL